MNKVWAIFLKLVLFLQRMIAVADPEELADGFVVFLFFQRRSESLQKVKYYLPPFLAFQVTEPYQLATIDP